MGVLGKREWRKVYVLILPVAICAGILGGTLSSLGTAGATTGPSYFLPKKHPKVNNKLELLYRGQYILRNAAKPVRITGGALGVEINQNGALYGVGQFYGFDKGGYQDSWVSTLYYFQARKGGVMTVDLLGPTGKPYLGKMYLHRKKNGDLYGEIQLGKRGKRYAIAWHKISNR